MSSPQQEMTRGAGELAQVHVQPQAIYQCGDCLSDVAVGPEDQVRCTECGYRILYKKRTTRVVQYEAR